MEAADKSLLNRRAIVGVIAGAVVLLVLVVFSFSDGLWEDTTALVSGIGPEFFIFVLGGFIAQMIDGSLGMAYGVSASTFLLSFGVPPAAASASIHTSEIFTTGVSGLSHLRFQNVNKKLFRSLLLPGIAGAVAGAYILSSFEEYNTYIRPIVAAYTLVLGVVIVRKAVRKSQPKTKTRNIPALATFGGFMDSIGGGGWGPIVASTLIAKGRSPRYTIGSVNLAEFFISTSSSITFFATIGVSYFQIIAGLVLGGIIAAPIAAHLTRKLPVKKMMIVVGVVVILVSIRLIVKAFV
ncbi:sulfite exporter TauE/SafE family protein [Chryseolinea lacunae]|uniref:Probable membrane transporter protein n=1 Tax=Chryseolinea lacunae TaxID=2801331 RepID=A0ABS1L279_9BACT|nr:sulfite exporter TauE/SafE family protein [Chryseolinea lacunae]MBL0745042.1 sulfite exporter TauE/SafE family protein [Chryseolinea lacunae]